MPTETLVELAELEEKLKVINAKIENSAGKNVLTAAPGI